MKQVLLHIAFLLLGAQTASQADTISSFLVSPSSASYVEMDRIADNFRRTPDPRLIAAVNTELLKSLNANYPKAKRTLVTELASKLGDPTSLPILVSHLGVAEKITFAGFGFSTFTAAHPYAAAIARFHSNAVPSVLDAVATSRDPNFDRVAETTVTSMDKDIIFQLLDRYQATADNHRLSQFITACIAIMARGQEGVTDVEDRIAISKNPDEQARLRELETDLRNPQLAAALQSGGALAPAWP